MSSLKSKYGLAEGLRALELLARLAPVGLEAYAKAGRFQLEEASALIETFETGGYVKRLPCDDLYVLQPLATDFIFSELTDSVPPAVSIH